MLKYSMKFWKYAAIFVVGMVMIWPALAYAIIWDWKNSWLSETFDRMETWAQS